MTGIAESDLDLWRGAVGRTEGRNEVLSAEMLRRFALATGAHPPVEDRPPALGALGVFPPGCDDADIGPDGHPRRGGFLPPVSLPRRMFAASAMEFSAPLTLGDRATMIARVADVSHKRGRSGDLVFVDVERTIEQNGVLCVRERQSFVYRDDGPAAAVPIPCGPLPEGERWQPDEVNLFRFSAATFNSHRIHYDLSYAREVEGYPALVIHGPFTATRLAQFAMRDGPLARFAFRAMAPLFLGQPVFLRSAESAPPKRCAATGRWRCVRSSARA